MAEETHMTKYCFVCIKRHLHSLLSSKLLLRCDSREVWSQFQMKDLWIFLYANLNKFLWCWTSSGNINDACVRTPFANATEQHAAAWYTELSESIVCVKEPDVSTLRMSRYIELLWMSTYLKAILDHHSMNWKAVSSQYKMKSSGLQQSDKI